MRPLLIRILKVLGYIAASIVGLVVVTIGLLWYFTRDMCANSVLAEVGSPNGQFKAVVFERDCGATTDFSTQVSVLSASDSLENHGGNVFVADSDHGKAPRGPGGGPDVRVTWLSDQRLRIEHHSLARVFKSEPRRKNVDIEYLTSKPDS